MGVKLNPFTGKLDVVDSPSGDFSTVELNRGTEESPSIAFDSDSDTGIYSPGADQVAISTNGTQRLVVAANGNVGVGTAPQVPLDVASNTSGYAAVFRGRSADNTSSVRFTSNDYAALYASFEAGPTYLATTVNGSEKLRITSDAYVRLASGTGGIQFGGDTAAANALDDYEEGTWVPNAGPGVTVSGTFSSVGRYTKIGRVVCYEGYISATTSVAFNPVGGVFVTGLPFSVVAGSGATGDAVNSSVSAFMHVIAGGTSLYGSTSIPATTTITFAGQYIV